CARAAPDRPAPRQPVTPLVMQRCPRQAAGNDGGEVSSTLIAPTPLATSTIDATAQKQYAKARHPCACSARRAERGSVKEKTGAPYGNRTRVSAVKGRRPRPLDEGRGVAMPGAMAWPRTYRGVFAMRQGSLRPAWRGIDRTAQRDGFTTSRYSASIPMVPWAAAGRPSEGVRSNACRASARRPWFRRAAAG